MKECNYCGKNYSDRSFNNHMVRCPQNPNRIDISKMQGMLNKKGSNQYIKAKENGQEIIISDSTRKKMSIASSKRTHSKETKKKISEARKKFLLENPDKVPYLINHYSNGPSYPERYFEEIFQNNNLKVEKEFRILNYSLDFAIPSKKIDIEIDGDQHYLDERIVENDNRRNEKLEELGWKIYRIRWSDYQRMSKEEKEKFIQEFIRKLK